ncbi:hypothetical protein ACEPAG_2070 [Sanghuangporus baumii]
MSISLLDVSAVTAAVVCFGLLRSWRKRRDRTRLPPGPRRLPLIGNALDMPPKEEWEAARKWGEKYGPVVYVEVFGLPYIFLNSYQAAVDLLEKRGSNYSSRPTTVMFELRVSHDDRILRSLMLNLAPLSSEGWTDWFPAVLPYGDELKRSRQMLHQFLQPSAVADYAELQTQATYRMLEGLLRSPDKYPELVRHSAAEIIMMMTYGHKVSQKNDPFVELGEKGMEAFAEAEGFFLVNAIPWLRHLPSWFPGMDFQKIAKDGYQHSMAMYKKPHEMTKKKLKEGTAVPSMVSKLMEANMGANGVVKDEPLIAKTAGVTYGGGADTTVSAMLTFLLAMVLYPDVQKRAQEELDRVVGKNNLPSLDDLPNLPYVEAICKECLRWQAVGPFGVAHMATEEDEYNGYYIPAGVTVLSNIWAMCRDPNEYENPDEFIPERWLPVAGKQPPLDIRKVAFGFGRRICPGRHFADNSVFIGVASVLSAFHITKALDQNGRPITPEIDYTPHFIRHSKPFKYAVAPRSEEIVKAIHQAVESAK